jgi:hypothetical protein
MCWFSGKNLKELEEQLMGGNGNGKGKKAWNLAEDGILWKRVIDYTSKEFEGQAHTLIMQLQAAVQPVDALQGLLLDRIAAGYLRKRLLLDGEASIRRHNKLTAKPAQGQTSEKVVFLNPFASPEASLRYEALLDQAFHRDLILLQKLKENGPVIPPLEPRKSAKPIRGLINGDGKSGVN